MADGDPDGFDAMSRACIAAHEAVMAHGSRELRAIAKLLLFALAQETASGTRPERHDRTTGRGGERA